MQTSPQSIRDRYPAPKDFQQIPTNIDVIQGFLGSLDAENQIAQSHIHEYDAARGGVIGVLESRKGDISGWCTDQLSRVQTDEKRVRDTPSKLPSETGIVSPPWNVRDSILMAVLLLCMFLGLGASWISVASAVKEIGILAILENPWWSYVISFVIVSTALAIEGVGVVFIKTTGGKKLYGLSILVLGFIHAILFVISLTVYVSGVGDSIEGTILNALDGINSQTQTVVDQFFESGYAYFQVATELLIGGGCGILASVLYDKHYQQPERDNPDYQDAVTKLEASQEKLKQLRDEQSTCNECLARHVAERKRYVQEALNLYQQMNQLYIMCRSSDLS
ncbi:MAG: hypothetical protein GKR96_12235 [Gammaproteobacteria bacterium]|nr:hypothetical protein [Gammaproteobacteria bacterium]